MRVEQRQVKDQPLTVIVEYPEYDKSVDNLIKKIKNMSISFTGKSDGKTVSIDLSDIYYIENVERKIFLYSRKDVYRYDGSMTDIDSSIADTDLVRISRTCFMNVSHLKEIMQIKISHLYLALAVACVWITENGGDAEKIMLEKHEFNKSRPYKHGKKF